MKASKNIMYVSSSQCILNLYGDLLTNGENLLQGKNLTG